MASRIHHLDSLTIDKIAAGEVIEIPASCVKELIDNSLDAGATEILIEISLGGRERIRITDNGCGMSKEDVVASIERHSTSKIKGVEDLEHLMLRGFRGEALSSIVAISHLTIISAEATEAGNGAVLPATSLMAEGGQIRAVVETFGKPGTTVEVSSLFYNVPARRKFLKSPHKDTQEIIKIVTLLALSAPSVGFHLIADGKQLLHCHPVKDNNIVTRIRALFGDPFQESGSFEIHHDQEGFSLHGVIGSPSQARSTRSAQHLVVNGRPVHSLPISYAVKNGYGTAIEQTKHPVFALHLSVDASMIDINVHPQKREIRLADEEWIRVLVQEAISKALFGSFASLPQTGFTNVAPHCGYIENGFSDPISVDQPLLPLESIATYKEPIIPVVVIGDVALFKPPHHLLKPCVSHDQLLLLDLKQAMKTIWFMELEQKDTPVVTDLLLVPITIECTVAEAAKISMHIPLLEKLGFVVRAMGPSVFTVEGLPAQLIDTDVRKLIFDILEGEGRVEFQKSKRLASIYVSSMRCLQHPILPEIAQTIFAKWATHGYPKIAPDGSFCFSYCDGSLLKEWISKQGVDNEIN